MIQNLAATARDKTNFNEIQDYLDFCQRYLDYIAGNPLQARLVAKNENNYQFWQYDGSVNYQITRPINTDLMFNAESYGEIRQEFVQTLQNLRDLEATEELRAQLNRAVYTTQHAIGASLDALPAGASNFARKINGDLFERLVKLILVEIGVEATSGVIKVPVIVDGEEQFKMSYQHDLIIKFEGEVKAIGSVKTTSKDRIDKVFMDKFLYSKITESDLPHIAIFLHDVQRAGTQPNYKVSSTYLPGHFKGYTVKLNPLDGVYYCDIRPRMRTEPILRDHIKTFDHLLCNDIWNWLQHHEDTPLEIDEEPEQ